MIPTNGLLFKRFLVQVVPYFSPGSLHLFLVLNLSGVEEHNLPDSPFASPTKAIAGAAVSSSEPGHTGNISSPHLVASSLFSPTTSTLELPPYKSCFFQVPRWEKHQNSVYFNLIICFVTWKTFSFQSHMIVCNNKELCFLKTCVKFLQVLSWAWSHWAVNTEQEKRGLLSS